MPNIKLENLSLGYQEPLFKNINLIFPSERISLLLGPSGCGKSTLLRLIAQTGQHSEKLKVNGNITVDEQPITEIKNSNRSHLISMLFQNPRRQFTMPTGRKEIQFALENLQIEPHLIPKRLTHALEIVGVANLADQSLDTLSGGEQQKMALAVIIAMDSAMILLDEPFASIDSNSRDDLLQVLKKLRDQHHKTIIIIDHNLAGYFDVVDKLYQVNELKIALVSASEQARMFTFFNTNQLTFTLSTKLPESKAIMTLNSLTLQQPQRSLLTNVNFKWLSNAITFLIGDNGTGKSSLFKAIIREMKYRGTISFQNTDIQKFKLIKYYRHVALVFQNADTQFIKLTVQEEIDFSLQNSINNHYSREQLTNIINKLELTNHLNQVVYSLSEGQKRKLQILTMLIMGNDLLLLDEPFAGLDYNSIQVISKLLRFAQTEFQQTFIIITHQIAGSESLMDHVVMLKNHTLQLGRLTK